MIDPRDLSAVALAKAGFVEQPMLQALAWTLLHFLWQGAALGFTAFVLLRVLRPERASTRYVIGVTTLALMLVAFIATFVAIARQPLPPAELTTIAPVSPASTPQGSSVTGWILADLNASPSARSLLYVGRLAGSMASAATWPRRRSRCLRTRALAGKPALFAGDRDGVERWRAGAVVSIDWRMAAGAEAGTTRNRRRVAAG